MTTRCERRGQLEIGIIDHDGRSYAAFGASVYGHNVTSYTRQQNGHISLTRWDSGTSSPAAARSCGSIWTAPSS